jgi:hypothetical protein
LLTLAPLVWLLSVTFSAGLEKMYSPDARIGFLAQARVLEAQSPALQRAVAAAEATGGSALAEAQKAVRTNRALRFNQHLDTVVAAFSWC